MSNHRDFPDSIKSPPSRFREVLRQIGPGLIVSGSIVGSGELIGATALGARVGFVALWVILLSCLIKVIVQEELGRYVISSGETTFEALNRVPGKIGPISWVVWGWAIMFIGLTMLSGGIIGSVGQAFHLAFPQIEPNIWMLIVAVLTAALLVTKGKFPFVQRVSAILVFTFTIVTMICAILLNWTPYPVHLSDIAAGLQFELPDAGLAVAFAVFGITGISAAELVMYPYWCLEKGYARYVGPREETDTWVKRAKGWLRVLRADVIVAMFFYTIATIAFYLLGAAVLHPQGSLPDGKEMVNALSTMYTETLGPWAFILFLFGSVAVLYSTVFVHAASYPRLLVDFFEQVGLLRVKGDQAKEWKWLRIFTVALIFLYVFWYLVLGKPVTMVIIGGVLQAGLLPILAGSTLYLRYKHLDRRIVPTRASDFLLWLAGGCLLAFAVYSLLQKLAII